MLGGGVRYRAANPAYSLCTRRVAPSVCLTSPFNSDWKQTRVGAAAAQRQYTRRPVRGHAKGSGGASSTAYENLRAALGRRCVTFLVFPGDGRRAPASVTP